MSNILWYQPAKLSDRDVIVYNGSVIEQDMYRSTYFARIKKLADKVSVHPRPWWGNVENHYFVKGSFNQKDEKGRLLSFMFLSECADDKKTLIQITSDLGFELDADTKRCIENESKKKYKILFVVIIMLLIASFIYIVSNYGK